MGSMGGIEIILLIVGGIVFLLSFIIPVQKKSDLKEVRKLAKEEIQDMVSKEKDTIRNHAEEMVEEVLQEGINKAERSLERLTNEKIMAVNEYSDTVLDEINRNHKEVVFLYDMLNDKHQTITSIVSEVTKTVKQAEKLQKELEDKKQEDNKEEKQENNKRSQKRNNIREREAIKDLPKESLSEVEMNEEKVLEELTAQNKNSKIRQLYQQGMEEVEIAKKLGLGVGEVKLVIGLYKGM